MEAIGVKSVRKLKFADGRADQVYSKLKELGLRLTPQRMAIVRYVMATESHPAADEVFKKMRAEHPTMSLTTVYTTLEMLARAGIVQAVNTRKVVRYDSHVPRHLNLICLNCSKIIDVDDEGIADIAKDKAGKHSFHIVDQQFSIYGYCGDCQAQIP